LVAESAHVRHGNERRAPSLDARRFWCLHLGLNFLTMPAINQCCGDFRSVCFWSSDTRSRQCWREIHRSSDRILLFSDLGCQQLRTPSIQESKEVVKGIERTDAEETDRVQESMAAAFFRKNVVRVEVQTMSISWIALQRQSLYCQAEAWDIHSKNKFCLSSTE